VAVVLDTGSSVPDRRLAVWQDIVCDTFVGLDCHSDMRDGFWGAVSQSTVGRATFTRVDSCAQRVFRTPSRIARASEDYVLVALGNSGVNGVYQDGREAVVAAGQFVIYDTTRPYELRFDDSFSQTILQMPRKLLQQRIGAFDALTATTFSSDRPLERLAYEFLLGMSKTVDHIDPATAARLLDQGLDLIAMAFADRACTFVGAVVSPIRAALSPQELHPDASARPRTVDGARRRSHRDLAALCQRFDRRRADLVPQLRPDAAPGAMQARSVGPGARRPAHQRHRVRVGL
jgi:hypothetical protein